MRRARGPRPIDLRRRGDKNSFLRVSRLLLFCKPYPFFLALKDITSESAVWTFAGHTYWTYLVHISAMGGKKHTALMSMCIRHFTLLSLRSAFRLALCRVIFAFPFRKGFGSVPAPSIAKKYLQLFLPKPARCLRPNSARMTSIIRESFPYRRNHRHASRPY